MPDISSSLNHETTMINLTTANPKDANRYAVSLLVPGESVVYVFKTLRDQVIFTDRRIMVVNVQGITGKKTAYFSYPYKKISTFAIQTAGVFDFDCELSVLFENGQPLVLDFLAGVDIKGIASLVGSCVL